MLQVIALSFHESWEPSNLKSGGGSQENYDGKMYASLNGSGIVFENIVYCATVVNVAPTKDGKPGHSGCSRTTVPISQVPIGVQY